MEEARREKLKIGGLMGQRWHHHSDQQGSAGTYP